VRHSGALCAFAQARKEIMKTERRKFKRYCIDTDKVMASFSNTRNTHTVKDISRGGVKIEYNPLTDGLMESEMIDIIAFNGARFYVPKISCETVYDVLTLMQDRSFKGSTMRTRGLKFVNLTKEQEDGLDFIINRCLDASA